MKLREIGEHLQYCKFEEEYNQNSRLSLIKSNMEVLVTLYTNTSVIWHRVQWKNLSQLQLLRRLKT